MSKLLEQAKAAAAKLKDQTEETGGFDYEPPAAGPALARFVSYVEIGKQPQRPYQGKPKPDAEEAILEFQLLGKKHAKAIEFEEEGKTVTKTLYPILRERIAIKSGSKATFYKLLQAMDYGRGNTHMAFMLGEGFLVNVVHNEVEKDGKKTVYANLRDDSGTWKIGAPVRLNDEQETEPLKVPPSTVADRLLLWEAPTVEQWASIYIPGEQTRKDKDGKETTVSKNWMQDLARSAKDYEGSALQVLLAEAEGDLPATGPVDVYDDLVEDDTPDEPDAPDGPEDAPGGPSGSEEADPLADLDL